jgi:hypothetical protein
MIGLEMHFRGDSDAAGAAYREALRIQPGHQLAAMYLRDLERGEPPGGGAVSAAAVVADEAVAAAG